jgi:hypothetical protein
MSHDRKPAPRHWSSEDVNAAIERVPPDVLVLLADGTPRARTAILAALADRHLRGDVKHTLMRLVVLGQLVEQAGRYTLGRDEG